MRPEQLAPILLQLEAAGRDGAMQRQIEDGLAAAVLDGNAAGPAGAAIDPQRDGTPHRLCQALGLDAVAAHRLGQDLRRRLGQFRRDDGQAVGGYRAVHRHDRQPGRRDMRGGNGRQQRRTAPRTEDDAKS